MPYAIETRGLSKQYRLGVSGTGWLARDVGRWLRKVFSRKSEDTEEEYFWALKDLDLTVGQGEILGVIGHNGAGKSTLLKLLSRITRPTRGEAIVRGRVASLLEVGTGFHPELTGRENIFLNGAIQGMTRSEVRIQFDEIVAFAGIESFVDTPVKRYSSGMYLRLAFAVAAHLQAEILLVDEVLAVGDVEFQRKCLEKIEDVGHQGRTVLFVSHNMGALASLCQTGLLLDSGKVVSRGSIRTVIEEYLAKRRPTAPGFARRKPSSQSTQVVECVELLNSDMKRCAAFEYGERMYVVLHMLDASQERFGLELRIRNSKLELVAYASSWISGPGDGVFYQPNRIMITIPDLNLVQDDYLLDFNFRIPNLHHVDAWWEAVGFTIVNCRPPGSPISIARKHNWGNVVLENVTMKTISQSEP